MKAYFETYQLFFKENLPHLFSHFSALQITPDIYIIDWSVLVAILAFVVRFLSKVLHVYGYNCVIACRDLKGN